MFRAICFFLLAVVALGLGACSSYERRWEAAAKAAPGGKAVEGSYSGTWQSDRGTFSGKLWCIVEPAPAVVTKRPALLAYRAQFRATWHGIFASEHEFILHGRRLRGGGIKFSDQAKLDYWIGGGTYDCAGEIRDGVFTARYDAHYDQGTFRMTRAKKKEDEQGRHLVHR